MNRAIHILQSLHAHTLTPVALIYKDQMAPESFDCEIWPPSRCIMSMEFFSFTLFINRPHSCVRSSAAKGQYQDFAFSSLWAVRGGSNKCCQAKIFQMTADWRGEELGGFCLHDYLFAFQVHVCSPAESCINSSPTVTPPRWAARLHETVISLGHGHFVLCLFST